MQTKEDNMRAVRSYIRRAGRITKRQHNAYQRLYHHFGIAINRNELRLADLFGREAPCILEIGFGMGEVTAEIAARHPQNDYLAVEVHRAGIGNLVALLEERDLTNVRIIEHDALEVVRHYLPANSLSAIHIYFPDPWPKKRHHKRRLIKAETAALFCQKQKKGGYIHVATDWQEYALEILAIFNAENGLQNTAEHFASRPDWRPQTKFEQKARKAQRQTFDILFKRR